MGVDGDAEPSREEDHREDHSRQEPEHEAVDLERVAARAYVVCRREDERRSEDGERLDEGPVLRLGARLANGPGRERDEAEAEESSSFTPAPSDATMAVRGFMPSFPPSGRWPMIFEITIPREKA